ncbi:hypothetical protein ES703_116409 [subsurface metagenome]
MVTETKRLTLSISDAAAMLGISRNLAFSLARQNKLPVPTIKLGERRMVVSRAAMEKMLLGGNGDKQDSEQV